MIGSMLSQLGGSGIKIATGSYVGNGAYQRKLSFDFKPMFVVISYGLVVTGDTIGGQTCFVRPQSVAIGRSAYPSDQVTHFDVTWAAKAVTFKPYTGDQEIFNNSGTTYYYIAFGE